MVKNQERYYAYFADFIPLVCEDEEVFLYSAELGEMSIMVANTEYIDLVDQVATHMGKTLIVLSDNEFIFHMLKFALPFK